MVSANRAGLGSTFKPISDTAWEGYNVYLPNNLIILKQVGASRQVYALTHLYYQGAKSATVSVFGSARAAV